MDPARRAMIEGRGPRARDPTSPRFDPFTRISKPKKPTPPAQPEQQQQQQQQQKARYLTQDEQSEQFVADEDKFVLKQAKKKADIRVRENRATPIDLLAFNLRHVDTDRDVFDDDEQDVEIEVPAPEHVIEELGAEELRELEGEITNYHTLEMNARNREYWEALRTIGRHRLQQLENQGRDGRGVGAVSDDVDRILSPKSYEQLEALEKQIKAKLESDEDIDTDYWEHLLESLLVWKARAKLKRVYKAIRDAKIEVLREKNPEKAAALAESDGALPAPTVPREPEKTPEARPAPTPPSKFTAIAKSQATRVPVGTARFSQPAEEDFSATTKALFEREVARGVSENEEIFTAEESVPGSQHPPQWADRYRPRKPRYFNRVQMGYEWNKYNQTHYDHDNPPPKVVQGYKFNIFYPDLIDKAKAPTYRIVREGGRRKGESVAPAGEADTCLIRFMAGPPYEDIAFRIVDREWDYSAKRDRGFRSTFDKVSGSAAMGAMFSLASPLADFGADSCFCRESCSFTSSSRR